MVTPRAGEPWPNLVSANSLLRRGLELFAAVRPIRIPDKGIDWTFFRENIEGEYIWGNKGIQVDEDLADSEALQLCSQWSCLQYGAVLLCRKRSHPESVP